MLPHSSLYETKSLHLHKPTKGEIITSIDVLDIRIVDIVGIIGEKYKKK